MERFLELINKYTGFEMVHAYRDEVDHVLGGKEDTIWYVIMKDGSVKEIYLSEYINGEWKDTHIKGKGKKEVRKDLPSGTVLKMIDEKAYLCQDEEWVKRKEPKPIEDNHPHYHYVYGMGDKALDVSVEYGVTISYNDLKDTSGAFHLRDLSTGKDVERP